MFLVSPSRGVLSWTPLLTHTILVTVLAGDLVRGIVT